MSSSLQIESNSAENRSSLSVSLPLPNRGLMKCCISLIESRRFLIFSTASLFCARLLLKFPSNTRFASVYILDMYENKFSRCIVGVSIAPQLAKYD